jgi:hypothetical protein
MVNLDYVVYRVFPVNHNQIKKTLQVTWLSALDQSPLYVCKFRFHSVLCITHVQIRCSFLGHGELDQFGGLETLTPGNIYVLAP